MEDAENEGWKTWVEYGKHSLQFTLLHFDSASFFTPTFSVNPSFCHTRVGLEIAGLSIAGLCPSLTVPQRHRRHIVASAHLACDAWRAIGNDDDDDYDADNNNCISIPP